MTDSKGFIVYASYEVEENRPYVTLFGRLENGESFKAMKQYVPYFYVKEEDADKAATLVGHDLKATGNRNFEGKKVVKIETKVPSDINKSRRVLEENEIECYEADIKFEYRFLMDLDIKGYVSIEGPSYKGRRIDNVFINPKINSAKGNVQLKVLSIDIETSEKGFEDFSAPIYSISLYGKDYKEVLILEKSCSNASTCKTEKELLEAFKTRIISYDPDVIIGWNLIDFDFLYLGKRFEKNKLDFDIGREESKVSLTSQKSFIRASRANVKGRMVLDAMHMLRDFFYRLEDYKLDTAGRSLIGEGKYELQRPISEIYENDPETLCKYNLKDSYLVYKIVEKENLIDTAMTLSSITGMMLDRVKASIATLDSLYIRKAKKEKIVCPSVRKEKRIAVTGGFVEEPAYGIYKHVALCDFRSLYPSIIATFNIDPLTFEKGSICAPNKVCFGKGKSILPHIILELLEERAKAKAQNEHSKQFAIKIIMNSIFGVLGNPNCRFYNSKIANAVTSFGRGILKETSQIIESWGYNVIYGDTDSVFVVTKAKDLRGARKIGKNIESKINDFYREYVKMNYDRDTHILLEFEKVYENFFLPKQRHLEKGAKKRYAGTVDGKLQIIGLEYVRRDWTLLAKEFQYNLLEKVFNDEDYEDYIRKYVMSLKKGEYNDRLIYRKRLRKDISKYTKTTPPHVKAAKMLQYKGKENSSLIEYVMTKKGPLPMEMANNIDYSHYIEKQIRPIAQSVLTLLGKDFNDVLAGASQRSLTDFFN